MQVKSIAERLHSAVLLTCIKIQHGFQTSVLSIFEWRLKTGFTVCSFCMCDTAFKHLSYWGGHNLYQAKMVKIHIGV